MCWSNFICEKFNQGYVGRNLVWWRIYVTVDLKIREVPIDRDSLTITIVFIWLSTLDKEDSPTFTSFFIFLKGTSLFG